MIASEFRAHITQSQVFDGLAFTEHNFGVDKLTEQAYQLRRQKLAEWMADDANKTRYQAEKSFFSQLKSGALPFGEKAARRIEAAYGMPHKFLDGAAEDSGTSIPLSREYISKREEELIQILRGVPPAVQQEIHTYAVTQYIKAHPDALTGRLDSIAPPRTAQLFGTKINADNENNGSHRGGHGGSTGRTPKTGKSRKA